MEKVTKSKKFKETTNYLVVLREHERGWGASDFAVHEFETFKEAKADEADINSENTAPTAPDYYIQARVITNPDEFHYYERFL